MSTRAASWLSWSFAGLSLAMFVAGVPLYLAARWAPVPRSWDANLGVGGFMGSALFLVFPLVGALIASRRPRNPIGWLLLADGLLWMLTNLMDYYAIYGVAQPGSVPFPVGIAGINNWLWVPAVGLLGTYPFLLFPDGKLPSRKWRPLAWLSAVMILLISLGVMLSPEPLYNLGGIGNPFALEGLPFWVENATYIVLPLLPICMIASVLSLVLRYRRSAGEERQQIKWIAFAASFVGLMYLIAMISGFIFPSGAWFAPGSPLWLDLIAYAALLSFTGIPIAVGFAVLKYRLYDIDVVINRALVYGALTATLALVYLGSVVLLQRAFVLLTGEGSQLTIVASTLAIAALFNPLRRRIQAFVDRRFYRDKYDAARTLEAFSAKLRDETDLEFLNAEMLSVVRETMRPAHASLWLRETAADEKLKADG